MNRHEAKLIYEEIENLESEGCTCEAGNDCCENCRFKYYVIIPHEEIVFGSNDRGECEVFAEDDPRFNIMSADDLIEGGWNLDDYCKKCKAEDFPPCQCDLLNNECGDIDAEEGEDVDAEEGEDVDAEEGEDVDAEEGEDVDAEEGEDIDAEEGEDVDAEEGEDIDAEEGEDIDAEEGEEGEEE